MVMRSYNDDYIHLLKKILCNSIYEQEIHITTEDVADCARSIDILRASKPWVFEQYKQITAESLAAILAYTKKNRNVHTYVSRLGLDNIEACARDVVVNDIPGDFIDAGTLRGGTAILMRGILRAYSDYTRNVVVADSFQGIPNPTIRDSIFDREIWFSLADVLPQYNLLCIESLERVRENFSVYGLLDRQVEFLPGWFSETLSGLCDRQFSLIRIDVDWYESVRDVLRLLYPMLSDGGYIIIDDYKLVGCKRAVDEFRVNNKIFDKISVSDEKSGIIFWKKMARKT